MTDTELLGDYLGLQDPEAFEALVRRHGPLVLRVCRDVLEDPEDAEDAFQATFLILVRRAEAIRDPDALGRWLYGVATRVSMRARADARRRRARERQGVDIVAQAPEHVEVAIRELRPVLHAELGRLPEKLRAPLVLCYLEELTYEDAARRLRLPLGTLKSRLVRGRELLRSGLSRRGITVSTLVLMVLLGERARAVPPGLLDLTVNAGAVVSRGRAALPPTIPSRVARLVERELEARAIRRWALLMPAVLAGLIGVFSLFVSLDRSLVRPAMARALEAGRVLPSADDPAPASDPDAAGDPAPLARPAASSTLPGGRLQLAAGPGADAAPITARASAEPRLEVRSAAADRRTPLGLAIRRDVLDVQAGCSSRQPEPQSQPLASCRGN